MRNKIGLRTWFTSGLLTIVSLALFVGATDAYNLELARVEYRDYAYGEGSHSRISMMFTDGTGQWVNPYLSDVRVSYMGSQIEAYSLWQDWLYEVSGSYDESTGQWSFGTQLETSYYLRVKIAPSSDFGNAAASSGTYRLSVDTDQGTIDRDLAFAGPQSLPRIDASTFAFSYNLNGDLTITWNLPDQSQFPSGSFLSLAFESGDDWHYAGYFSMPTDVSSITIPAEAITLLGDPDAYNVSMRTHSQDNSTRFYSDTVTVQTTDIATQSDKDGWVVVNGTVTYDSAPVCAMVLINGQYMFSCGAGDDYGKYLIEAPLDGNGELLVQTFVSGKAPYRLTTTPMGSALNIAMQAADPESSSPVVTTATATDDTTPSGWARITGTVTDGESDLCAMVLANGKYMFSCGANSGIYDLTAPLDGNGDITLYVFVAGLQPYKQTFAP